ncbi:MAG: CD1871A family CXXC motif-containing protein [Thermodesulfobacteriota bacterium]
MRKGPFIIIGVFFLLCLIGMISGEVKYVLQQAVSICLDCIGIG